MGPDGTTLPYMRQSKLFVYFDYKLRMFSYMQRIVDSTGQSNDPQKLSCDVFERLQQHLGLIEGKIGIIQQVHKPFCHWLRFNLVDERRPSAKTDCPRKCIGIASQGADHISLTRMDLVTKFLALDYVFE